MIKKHTLIASVMMAMGGMAFASNDVAYVTSSDGKPVMSGFGICWTSSGTKTPMEACGDVIKKEEKVEEKAKIPNPYVVAHKVEVTPEVKKEEKIHVVFASSVLFKFDSDVLSEEGKAILNDQVVAHNPKKLDIHGHTDRIGPAEYNMQLSLRRANAVRNYLMTRGIDPSIITTKGHGETSLLCQEQTRACNQMNRRVEINGVK